MCKEKLFQGNDEEVQRDTKTLPEGEERRVNQETYSLRNATSKNRWEDHISLVNEIITKLLGKKVVIATTTSRGEKITEVCVRVPLLKPQRVKVLEGRLNVEFPTLKDVTAIWNTDNNEPLRIRFPIGNILINEDEDTIYTIYDNFRVNIHIQPDSETDTRKSPESQS